MAANKIVMNTENGEVVLMDLTNDTITPETLAEGVIAHDASGQQIIGLAPTVETDPTVPAWAKASTKPSYSKSEVGLGNVDNVKQYSANNPPPYPITKVNNKTGEVTLSAVDVGAIAQSDLNGAVNTALAQAKENGEFDGVDGEDGYSMYYSTEVHPEIGSDFISDLSVLHIDTGGRKIQIGDFVILNKRYLYKILDVGGTGSVGAGLIGDLKGDKGNNGTSVTVSSVSESTTSGGTNIVNFSDGKKVSIKNGNDGTPGKSAYQYAKDGGYTGTEQEFTENLAKEKADLSEGSIFVEGSGTTDSSTKTSTWLGSSNKIIQYYDGLAIRYKIGVAGQTTTTLNINNLGAKSIYLFNTTKVTTQFPVNSIINLIYHTGLNNGCWMCSDYDSNTNTYQRVYESSDNKEYAITARYNTTDGASYYAEYGRYTNGVTINPATNTITASAFKGTLNGGISGYTEEQWVFTLSDGSTVTKTVMTK